MIALRHGRVKLALHPLREGPGRSLLLLHGLGESSPLRVPEVLDAWPGPVHALDFTGHGASTRPRGGGYTAELLMADADAALAHLGEATLVGRGLGAYVALLLAGARPAAVRGAILRDGPGLAGGGPDVGPAELGVPASASGPPGSPDPFALLELARDVRPPDYATMFAERARELSGLDRPVAVCADERPPWLAAVADRPEVGTSSLADALAAYRSPGPVQ